jgi:hypothetical protein
MSTGARLRQKNAIAGPSSVPQYDQEDDHVTTLYNNPVRALT